MAHSPTMRPDPLETAKPLASVPADSPSLVIASESSVARIQPQATQGIEGNELGLDLILHDIAERARQATNASGAAIAIRQDENMVCRAAAGATVPDLGAKIATETGLSGACVRTGETQWCSDTETDERVDAEACRQLGVRSVIVVPVFAGDSLVGAFEVFSPKPQAFCEQDLHTLQDLAQWVTEAVQGASGAGRQQGLAVVAGGSAAVTVSQLASRSGPYAMLARSTERVFDPRNRLLLLSIGIVALTLCSLLAFRWGWQKAHSDRIVSGRTVSPSPQASPVKPQPQSMGLGTTADISNRQAALPKPQAGKLRGGLTVYDKGSVIYQQVPRAAADLNRGTEQVPPTASAALVGARPDSHVDSPPISTPKENSSAPVPSSGSSAQSGEGTAGKAAGTEIASAASPNTSAADTTPVRVSQGVKEGRLLHRIDPRYPPAAALQHIEGPVVLAAKIGKDGKVHDLKAVSGNTYLTQAALQAVSQWRYEPYTLNGEPVDMKTDITVVFKLPK